MADEDLNIGEFDPPAPPPRVKGVNGVLFVLGLAWVGGALAMPYGSYHVWKTIGLASPGLAQAALSYAAVYHPRQLIARMASLPLLMGSVPVSVFILLVTSMPYVSDRTDGKVALALAVSLVIASACCFRTNWAWGKTLSEWDARCRATGRGTAAERARWSALRVSLREALGVTCFVALLLGIGRMALYVPPLRPTQFYEQVRREDAPVELPADARDIRYRLRELDPNNYKLMLEFTCSEASFRDWRPAGTARGVIPFKGMVGDFKDRTLEVDRGLQQRHNSAWSGFDLDTGRVYYHTESR